MQVSTYGRSSGIFKKQDFDKMYIIISRKNDSIASNKICYVYAELSKRGRHHVNMIAQYNLFKTVTMYCKCAYRPVPRNRKIQ